MDLAYNIYCQIEFFISVPLQLKVWGEMRLTVDINCNSVENAKEINSESESLGLEWLLEIIPSPSEDENSQVPGSHSWGVVLPFLFLCNI